MHRNKTKLKKHNLIPYIAEYKTVEYEYYPESFWRVRQIYALTQEPNLKKLINFITFLYTKNQIGILLSKWCTNLTVTWNKMYLWKRSEFYESADILNSNQMTRQNHALKQDVKLQKTE